MKTRLMLFLGLGLITGTAPLPAQQPAPAVEARFTADQLDDLLGPIALYPDALIALILPAATMPSDIVLAARYLQGGGDPARVEDQSWDDSVEALAHYPDVIQWMDQNLAWTKQLGEVFAAQPVDVMQAIQRLRARARESGALADTPQQQVVMEGADISIVPAQPDVIYVPRYDPEVVYYAQRPGYYPGPFLTFGVGFSTGLWLSNDVDWGQRRIWVVDRHDQRYDGRDHRDWRHPVFPGQPGYVSNPYRTPWHPPSNVSALRPPVVRRGPPQIVQPAFLPGTPPRPPGWNRDDRPDRRPDNSRPLLSTTPGHSPPGQFQGPIVQPLQGPLVQPFQQPLVQPLRPPQATPPPTDRRRSPEPPLRERNRDDRTSRGSEPKGTDGTRTSPPPPSSINNGVRSTNSQLPPPRTQPSDDDKRKEQDKRD